MSSSVVGNYTTDMTYTGHNLTIEMDSGETRYGLGYNYHPMPGLYAKCEIFVNAAGAVLGTKVISEVEGGGDSTISGELKV